MNERAIIEELVACDGLKKSLAEASMHTAKFQTDENYAMVDKIATELARREATAKAAARAFLAAPVGDGWMPIETAPKDGTGILVCGGTFYRSDEHSLRPAGRPQIVHWISDAWFGGQVSNNVEVWRQPTLWMPLPSAPTAESSAPAAVKVKG